MNSKISHSGTVEQIDGNCVKVRIMQTTACASCKIAGHCNASEQKVKVVDVMNVSNAQRYKVGQQVVVSASKDVANRALLLGFGLPLILLVTVLVVVLQTTGNEGVAALSALGVLVPYYIVVWLMRDRIAKRISFELESEEQISDN